MAVAFAKLTQAERGAVDLIVQRAEDMYRRAGQELDHTELRLDLAATHAHTPLDLGRLADAENFDFAHDIGGIQRHLDRRTGELEDCFVPRCARRAT